MVLVDDLIQRGWLKTDRLIRAFRKIKRQDFLPAEQKYLSGIDEALPIGFGQTISQPLVVAFMLELLRPQEGDKVLDIGSGSGWTTALLAEVVGNQGKVIAIEIVPELKDLGEQNTAKYNFVKKGIAQFFLADGSLGWQTQAPYDKILCSAAIQGEQIPEPWKDQLKIGGRLVAPLGNSIFLFVKKQNNEIAIKEFPGFVFVPLVKE